MSKKRASKKTTIKPTKSTISTPTVAATAKSTLVKNVVDNNGMLFNKTNYMYILGGIGLMAIGFFLMAGGSMPSPDVWDDSIIYGTQRTLIAPIFIIVGLVVQVFAIFKR